jgi:tetratricopeptide (TPR) repeat protein
VVCALLLSAFAFSQSQNVEMRINLFWAGGHRLGASDEGNAPGMAGVSRNVPQGSSDRVAGNSVSNMSIRVVLQNEDGTEVAENSPDGEGVVKFTVLGVVFNSATGTQSFPIYKLIVRGPDIEEQFLENLQPGLADRVVTIELHRKGEKREPGGLVSTSALKIPRKAESQWNKGSKALAKHKLRDARHYFEKAIAIYPQYDAAYNSLGVTKVMLGEKEAGKKDIEHALAINDHFALAYVNLARLLAGDKDYDGAARALQRSLSIEPLNPDALSLLCQYDVLRGSYAEVPALAQKLHSVPHDGDALGHFAAGNALEHLNRPTEAIFEYMLFMQEAPTDKLAASAKEAVDRLRQQTSQTNNPQ